MTELGPIALHCFVCYYSLLSLFQIRVMHQQLVFFNESMLRYFGGTHSSLEPLVKEMKEKLEGVSRDGSECLEDGHEP